MNGIQYKSELSCTVLKLIELYCAVFWLNQDGFFQKTFSKLTQKDLL